MPESDELFSEVAQMRDELEEQGAMIDALVHIGGDQLRTQILEAMASDDALREVYALVNGQRTQGEIAADLEARGIAKKSSVSLKLEKLALDFGLVQHARTAKEGKIYRRTRLGRTLKIDRALDKAKPRKP